MKTADIKTIDIKTLKWFDKTYGNTYFAQRIVINYGMSDSITLHNPYQYGYSSYDYEAFKFLQKNGFEVPNNLYELQKLGIIVRTSEEYAKKRDLIYISEMY